MEAHLGLAVLALWEKLAADFPSVPDYRRGLADSYNSLGLLLGNLGKRAEGELRYRKALAIREKLAADFPTVPDYRQSLALSHNNLGALLAGQGRRAEAEEQYRKGLAIREKLAADFPTVPEYRQSLGDSHNNLGILLGDVGERAEAEEQSRKCFAIREKLTADFPTVPEYRSDLALSHNSLGILLKGLGKRAEAEEQYRKALAIRKKLAADFPSVPDYRQSLGDSHNSLGILLGDVGKRVEAEDHYKQGLALREKLAADFPALPDYRVSLGGSYRNLGLLIRDGGKPNDSLAWFDKAIRTLRPVHEAEPHAVTAKHFLRDSYISRAMAFDTLGHYAEAIKDWDKTIEISPKEEQLAFRANRATSSANAGMVAEAVAEVTELTKSTNWDANQRYNFACVYAAASGKIVNKKAEYADQAMELLAKAVKAGYRNTAHMKTDTDLDALRDREDFRKLFAELKEKVQQSAELAPLPREKK